MKIIALLSIMLLNGLSAEALTIEETRTPGVTSKCISYPGAAPVCTGSTSIQSLHMKESVAY